MKKSKYIDHTLLKPESTKAQVQKIVDEAIENGSTDNISCIVIKL